MIFALRPARAVGIGLAAAVLVAGGYIAWDQFTGEDVVDQPGGGGSECADTPDAPGCARAVPSAVQRIGAAETERFLATLRAGEIEQAGALFSAACAAHVDDCQMLADALKRDDLTRHGAAFVDAACINPTADATGCGALLERALPTLDHPQARGGAGVARALCDRPWSRACSVAAAHLVLAGEMSEALASARATCAGGDPLACAFAPMLDAMASGSALPSADGEIDLSEASGLIGAVCASLDAPADGADLAALRTACDVQVLLASRDAAAAVDARDLDPEIYARSVRAAQQVCLVDDSRCPSAALFVAALSVNAPETFAAESLAETLTTSDARCADGETKGCAWRAALAVAAGDPSDAFVKLLAQACVSSGDLFSCAVLPAASAADLERALDAETLAGHLAELERACGDESLATCPAVATWRARGLGTPADPDAALLAIDAFCGADAELAMPPQDCQHLRLTVAALGKRAGVDARESGAPAPDAEGAPTNGGDPPE